MAILYGLPKPPYNQTYPWGRPFEVTLYGVTSPGTTAYAVPCPDPPWIPPWPTTEPVVNPFPVPPVPGPVSADPVASLEQRLVWVNGEIEKLIAIRKTLEAGIRAMKRAGKKAPKKP